MTQAHLHIRALFTPVGLGNMSWPGCGYGTPEEPTCAADRALADRLVKSALDSGIRLFDTAAAYGCGRAERLLGQSLKQSGQRDRACLVTKVGPVFGAERGTSTGCRLDQQWIIQQCERSLTRLGADRIDLYLAHRPDPSTPVEDTIGAFELLRASGKILSYGLSNFPADLLRRASLVGNVAAIQEAYSLGERGFEQTLLHASLEADIPLIAYSPLAKGILAGSFAENRRPLDGDPRQKDWHFQPANRLWIDRIARTVLAIADSRGVSAATIALAWCHAQPAVASVVAGARTTQQIEAAAAAAQLRLTKAELHELILASSRRPEVD
jgi:aryl-alcohol dehydrogenase-like predicted oxidoreductase